MATVVSLDEDSTAPTSVEEFSNRGPRRFGLPGLVVPDDFDAPLPNVDLAACDEMHLTVADLERAGMAAEDLDDPQVMRRAWE